MTEIARPEKTEVMTHLEINDLNRNESIIQRGIRSFIEVGQALQDIRHRRLWRGDFSSFEEYLREQWGMGAPYATRLIKGSEIAQRLPNIQNEAQAREISKVPYVDQERVLERAIDYASKEERQLSAKDIRSASFEPSDMTARDTDKDVTKTEEMSELWQASEEMLKDVKEIFRRLTIMPEGCWLKVHIDTLESRIKDCQRISAECKPHLACPECVGGLKSECDTCRNRGWLPKNRYDLLMKIKKEKELADTLTTNED